MIAAAMNIGLNYLLIPRFGYIAAAYTTLFGYLFLLVFHTFSLYGLGKRNWYDSRFNYMIVAVFIIMVPITNFLYKTSIVRYVTAGVFFIVTIVMLLHYRKEIVNYLRIHLGVGKNNKD